MNEECWVTLREAPSGLHPSNATDYNGGNLRNGVAPQPTIYSDFQVNRPHRRGLAVLNPYMKMWFK